ncbi:precorrin-6Y C5,15-methyltransferase (decarboxylating) subunit CbiT [Tessaracoccus lacteus]|uniref:Precorrin-6Y C5,15-methyltransferase (Decarboxylating) subunit CbiT n=1 Tax=Tessaracoccus lacteus TaxID=3041766 RepID=A0ABY8PUQ0_9ACTN|nr:precorrin-6Y C5,15-methyltransferase (decarboxylating) subunit CbiT [Tessaracoccus sp. T21]WGT46165.1 precorrin-6Y C5,15-methyltransferase (decarboxylating) subunit CbiT [Tessaracoccus sp. T21]
MIIDRDQALFGSAPGLPDAAFAHDGLITKRVVRASALAHLRPLPGQLLWDVGTGAGSISVEWCRGADGARAIGIERRAERAERALANADRLTVPGAFTLAEGDAEEMLRELPAPHAVFVGGGGSMTVLEIAHAALPEGGRLVLHGVTIEAEMLAVAAQERWGGELCRIQVETAAPLGGLRGWTPARTVIQWALVKE